MKIKTNEEEIRALVRDEIKKQQSEALRWVLIAIAIYAVLQFGWWFL